MTATSVLSGSNVARDLLRSLGCRMGYLPAVLPRQSRMPCRGPHSIYKRHGTTTLFAALNTLDGVVLGRCMQRHRHQEFIRFLNAVERAVPAGKLVHAIVDNYATHTHPKVKAWLVRHPRWSFHFTRNPVPGSTPSKASSPNSPVSASGVASSNPSSTYRPPSTAISRSTTMIPSPSCGPNLLTPSSPSSTG